MAVIPNRNIKCMCQQGLMNTTPCSPRHPPLIEDLLRTELVMHGANHDPHAYGIVDDVVVGADGTTRKSKILQPRKELNVAQQLANWCYINPFKMVGECRNLHSYPLCIAGVILGGGFLLFFVLSSSTQGELYERGKEMK